MCTIVCIWKGVQPFDDASQFKYGYYHDSRVYLQRLAGLGILFSLPCKDSLTAGYPLGYPCHDTPLMIISGIITL
jgi:hypothetical protein